jgi:hypothetical protein
MHVYSKEYKENLVSQFLEAYRDNPQLTAHGFATAHFGSKNSLKVSR